MAGLRRQYRFTCVPEQLIRDTGMSDRAVRLWALLDRYAAGAEATMPSRRELSDDLVCSLDSIDRALSELRKGGWLLVNEGLDEGKKTGKPSEYVLVDIPARRAAPTRHGCRTSAAPPAAPKRHPQASDQRKPATEKKKRVENPPSPDAAASGEPCKAHKHLGRLGRRCRDCGTAGRPKVPTPQPPPPAAVLARCPHDASPGHCPACRRESAR